MCPVAATLRRQVDVRWCAADRRAQHTAVANHRQRHIHRVLQIIRCCRRNRAAVLARTKTARVRRHRYRSCWRRSRWRTYRQPRRCIRRQGERSSRAIGRRQRYPLRQHCRVTLVRRITQRRCAELEGRQQCPLLALDEALTFWLELSTGCEENLIDDDAVFAHPEIQHVFVS